MSVARWTEVRPGRSCHGSFLQNVFLLPTIPPYSKYAVS